MIHTFLVIEGRLTAAEAIEVLKEAGIPHEKFKRLSQVKMVDVRQAMQFFNFEEDKFMKIIMYLELSEFASYPILAPLSDVYTHTYCKNSV